MFRLVEYYLGIVEQQEVRIPDGFRDRMSTVADVERAVAVNALPWVPCHNDLLAENYIDDGRQLWIIDFEYSGNNDPCFELGDTAQECEFDEELRAALCGAYFGRDDPVQLARMELFAYMADMGWTLWAAIQATISEIDYDFWGWAEERWGRAVALMDSGGNVLEDIAIARAEHDLRSLVSLDTQDAYLFSTTIRENVRLARPDADDATTTPGPSAGSMSAYSACLRSTRSGMLSWTN